MLFLRIWFGSLHSMELGTGDGAFINHWVYVVFELRKYTLISSR